MRIISSDLGAVQENRYVLDVNGQIYQYTDYVNRKGKVIDSSLVDPEGRECFDEELIAQAQELVDKHQSA